MTQAPLEKSAEWHGMCAKDWIPKKTSAFPLIKSKIGDPNMKD